MYEVMREGQSTWIIQWLLRNGEWCTFISVLLYSTNTVILQITLSYETETENI